MKRHSWMIVGALLAGVAWAGWPVHLESGSGVGNVPDIEAAVTNLQTAVTNLQVAVAGITETDPVFTNHPAYGLSAQDVTNSRTAYQWGNHAAAGYVSTETDPVWGAVSNTVTENASQGNMAYAWLSSGLSVTNEFIDGAGVTQRLEFSMGVLLSWSTNGVALP